MEVASQDDEEDKLMGFVDIAEFIKKTNSTNETGDWTENLDGGIDNNLEGSFEQITEETILFQISPTCVIAIILIVSIVSLIIFNSTNGFKSIYKFLKTFNKHLNHLLIFHVSNGKSFHNEDKSSTIKSYETSISSSGSGPGESLIRQRTIGDEIDFITRIDVGSYGRVWICNYRGRAVACRVYNTLEQNLWSHEVDIQIQLKNPEVAGMIVKDIRDDPITSSTQFLLVTDYFPNGSLHEFLKTHPIDETTMVNLMYSISSGLTHLHSIILGNPDKPAIIHFNIKSRNIMVSDCGSKCLISDFSTACLYNKDYRISESPKFNNNNHNNNTNHCNGETLRYRAPELLINNQLPDDLQSARACDVYSLALVFWEIASRCILPQINEPANGIDYKLPYEDELNNQSPNQQIMYQLVHLNKVRPKIDINKWSTSPTLIKIIKLLNESWTSFPASRLTSLRIKKDLDNLKENLKSPDDSSNKLISIEIA